MPQFEPDYYIIEVVGADPYGRWPRTHTSDHKMALRTALSFIRAMEKLGAPLPIKITGPGYDGTPLNAYEVRTQMWLHGDAHDRISMLQSN